MKPWNTIILIITLVAVSALFGCSGGLPPGETYPSLMDKAEQYYDDEKYELALQELDKIHTAYSKHFYAHHLKYRIHQKQNRYDLVVKDYDNMIDSKKTMGGLYVGRGEVYLRLGDTERALKDANKAIKLAEKKPHMNTFTSSSTYGEPWMFRSKVYEKLGERSKSGDDRRRACAYGVGMGYDYLCK